MVEHVVDGQQGDARPLSHRLQSRQPATVVAASKHGRAQPDRARRTFSHARQDPFKARQPIRRHDDQQHVLGRRQQVAEADLARALLRAAIAQRQQTRQPAPAGACLGIGQDIRSPVVEDQACAKDQLEGLGPALHLVRQGRVDGVILIRRHFAGTRALAPHIGRQQPVLTQGLERAPGPDHAGDGVAVRKAHARVPAQDGRRHQLLGRRGAAQKREVAGHGQLGVIALRVWLDHANRP